MAAIHPNASSSNKSSFHAGLGHQAVRQAAEIPGGNRKGLAAVDTGDIHAAAAPVEIEQRAADGATICNDIVLDDAREAAAALGEIPAHLIVARLFLPEEFGAS